ncbi:MAG: AraC family transcriptional regulator ligand-binding domain-containing protein [Acidobacteriota bacterium]|nr:AraC family transcriptional regulator ligand-binding domain-containing protein [Acidobacteriota bacterium]
MGKVTALFAHRVAGILDPSVDRAALLAPLNLREQQGLQPTAAPDPAEMIAAADYYAFLERAVAADPDGTTVPLRAGAAMRCDDYGAFGFAFKSATTLRGSYRRADRHARVLSTVSTYGLESTSEGAYMHLHRAGERTLGLRISNEATLASIRTISQEVSSQSFRALAVYFQHPPPTTTEHHEAFFGCPVHFKADRDALLVSEQSLAAPNKLGDASIARFFDTHLEAEIAKLEDRIPLERLVRDRVKKTLSEGVPALSAIAADLGMSARTLQRHLSEQGYSYQSLVDEARCQLAKRLISRTDYPLIEVAFMTGFSDQSAFTRAFKRWMGQTPRSFQLSV